MQSIERRFDGSPTIFNGIIEDEDKLCNTIVGFGTIVIDKEFLDDMETICNKFEETGNLIYTLTDIQNEVNGYFFNKDFTNTKSRAEVYDSNSIADEEGMIIGTKLSSLKGQNVAQCSEKSLASYIIFKKLLEKGKVTRIPSLVLSQLSFGENVNEPHAFVMLNKDCEDPTRHLIFDPENPAVVKNTENGSEGRYIGLYSLTDEEYDNFVNGLFCSPTNIFEYYGPYEEIGEKRTYGRIEKDKLK